jgi:hypothetical protein
MRARAILVVALALALSATARASTLDDYHSRVANAVETIEVVSDEESNTTAEEAVSRARQMLPPRETVEFDGRSIEVDNSWLAAEADAYTTAATDADRAVIFERIAAGLYAIDVHLDAIEAAAAHATPEDRAKLDEILARREFRAPEENAIAKYIADLRKRIGQMLEELLAKLFGNGGAESIGRVLRVVIVAGGLLALILLGRSVVQAIQRRKTDGPRAKKRRTVLGEEVDESTTAADLASAARALAAAGDFRGAVRKLFVALIYQLDERGLVRLRTESTNREYLALVRGFEPLHPVMATMTDVFERVWYGSTEIDRAGYESFEILHRQAASIVDARTAQK